MKWNAPGHHYKNDIVTFNSRAKEHEHLVFHHPEIDTMKSPLYEGGYKGRKRMYLRMRQEVTAAKKGITRIMRELAEIGKPGRKS